MQSVYVIIACLLIILLALNVVLRLYVFRLYRKLIKAEVDFEPKHFFNQKKLEEEVIPKYPEHADVVRSFVKWVQFSMTMASIMLVLILYLGYTLIQSR